MVFDDEFPVYGNVTSIDQVERIQEYVDNKILDALSWIAGKLDLIIRGHTLVIGTIIETSGKQIKQEQRRIQRVIDKNEKTAEIASFANVLGNHVPIGDFPVPPQGPVPPIEEPFPYDPDPELPPPPSPPPPPPVNPDFPPTNDQPTFPEVPRPDIPVGREFPPPPPPPPPPPSAPDEPLPREPDDEYQHCWYGSTSEWAENRPTDGTIVRNNSIIYGGQLDTCTRVKEYGYEAFSQLQFIFGHSREVTPVQGTGIIAPYTRRMIDEDGFYRNKASTVYNLPVSRCTASASSPYEETGEYIARGNTVRTDGTAFPIDGNDLPDWLFINPALPSITEEPDGIGYLGNFNPSV